MNEIDSRQEQRGEVSREMKTPGKNKNEMLEVKITVKEVKNAFDGLIVDLT